MRIYLLTTITRAAQDTKPDTHKGSIAVGFLLPSFVKEQCWTKGHSRSLGFEYSAV